MYPQCEDQHDIMERLIKQVQKEIVELCDRAKSVHSLAECRQALNEIQSAQTWTEAGEGYLDTLQRRLWFVLMVMDAARRFEQERDLAMEACGMWPNSEWEDDVQMPDCIPALMKAWDDEENARSTTTDIPW